MNEELSAKLAEAFINFTKYNSHPIVVKFDKLVEFGKPYGYTIKATEENFKVWHKRKLVGTFDKVDEINNIFKKRIGKGAW